MDQDQKKFQGDDKDKNSSQQGGSEFSLDQHSSKNVPHSLGDPKNNVPHSLGDPKNNVPTSSGNQKNNVPTSSGNQKNNIPASSKDNVNNVLTNLEDSEKDPASSSVDLKNDVSSGFGKFKGKPYVKLDEKFNLEIIYENDFHSIPKNKSFLKKNSKEWSDLTESLQIRFGCTFFANDSFLVAPLTDQTVKEQIDTEITEFFDPDPSDIKISRHVLDFMQRNKKFDNLKTDVMSEDKIWIRQVRKLHLGELKKELARVVCQSCLVNDNQYSLLREAKKGILSNIEKDFQLKASPYQLPLFGETPTVFQVNKLTNIFCVADSDLKNIPLDFLIHIDCQASTSEQNHSFFFKTVPWVIPTNQEVYAKLSSAFTEEEEINLFEDYFKDMLSSFLSTIVGIQLHSNLPIATLRKLVSDLTSSVAILKEQTKINSFNIILIANDAEIVEIKKTIEDISYEENFQKIEQQKSLQWISFVNYSEDPKNLEQGLKNFQAEINNLPVPFTINSHDLEDLIFFKDIFSLVPDIIEQYPEKSGEVQILVLKENLPKLKRLQEDIKSNLFYHEFPHQKKLNSKQREILLQKCKQDNPRVKFNVNSQNITFSSIDSEMKEKVIDHLKCCLGLKKYTPTASPEQGTKKNNYLHNDEKFFCTEVNKNNCTDKELKSMFEEIRSDYPKVKFTLKDDGQIVIQTPDRESNEIVKFQLECNLGIKTPVKVSQDRFAVNSEKPTEFNRSNIAAASTKKYRDICCFQTKESLLVKVYCADILDVDVEGIVNAANKYLRHSGGVARAIIEAAGDVVNKEGQTKLNGGLLDEGEVLSTSAGNLNKYKNIIHAVGPTYGKSQDLYCKRKIEEVVFNSLTEANSLDLSSIAIPAISSAIFAVPIHICTEGYYKGVEKFSSEKKSSRSLQEIHFVDIDQIRCKEIKDYFANYLQEVSME